MLVQLGNDMKHYVYEPGIKKIEKVLPYSVAVPQGYKTHAQALCQRILGKRYCRWDPRWRRVNNWTVKTTTRWTVYEDAVWHYKDGILYFKDEANTKMLTMVLLSKTKRR